VGVHKAAIVERRLGEDCENFEQREDAKSGIFRVRPVVSSADRQVKIARMLLALLTTQQAVMLRKKLVRLKNAKSFGVLDFAIEVEL